MRLIRYFGSLYAGAILLTLVGLVILLLAAMLMDSADNFAKHDAGVWVALQIMIYGGVQYGYQLLPIACFVGALVAGTLLARRGELMAAQAAGISSAWVITSFMVVVLAVSAMAAVAGEYVVPRATAKFDHLQYDVLGLNSPLARFYQRRSRWFRDGDKLLYLPVVDVRRQIFRHPVIYFTKDGTVDTVVEAQLLVHSGDHWELHDGHRFEVNTLDSETFVMRSVELSLSPRDLIDISGDPGHMRADEIAGLIDRRAAAGFDTTSHQIELQNRTSLPMAPLWLFILVAPWALHPERKRALATTLGGGVIAMAGLLATTHLLRLLALGHKIPLSLGAWSMAIVALVGSPISYALYRRYRITGSIF